MNPWRKWLGWLAALLVLLLLHAMPAPAIAETSASNPTITAVVAAGSAGNSVNIYVTNANSWASLRAVDIAVAGPLKYVTGLSIEPPRIEELAPNTMREVKVRFDVTPDVPDQGARETVVFNVSAADGILDQSELTLRLGIETESTSLNVVPFVVGMPTGEATQELASQGLGALTEEAPPPADPALLGTVAEQGTPAGEIVLAGTKIALTIFPAGSLKVPETAGLLIEEATRLVADAGLKPKLTLLGDAPSEEVANRVEHSEPAAGAPVEADSNVALFAYGAFKAEPEPGGPPPPVAGRGWERPWRGELKLTLLIVDGQRMSILDVLRRYMPKPEPEPQEAPAQGGIAAVPGAIARGITDVIEAGMGGAMEAIAAIASGVADMLEAGAPLSFTLVEEQGGFRLRVPGSSPLVDKLNTFLVNIPLLLPEGGNLLKTTLSRDDANGSFTLTMDATASPDWSTITLRMSLKGTGLKQEKGPRSIELVLTGTARQGLYEAAEYEKTITQKFTTAVTKYLPQSR